MLKQITHIEGLDSHYEDLEMPNDTPPVGVQVKFDVVQVEQPFLTAQEGRPIYKDEVFIIKEWELGRSKFRRKVRDAVVYEDGKFKIKKLAPRSDIKQYPDEWNAFMRGATDATVGTPLSLLFRNDPSRAERYYFLHINTIEKLASLNESNAQDLGMDARSDIERAREFIKRTKEQAPALEMNLKLEQKDQEIISLRNAVADLTEKLTQVLNAQINEAKPASRSRTKKAAEEE